MTNLQRARRAVQIKWLDFEFPQGFSCGRRLGWLLDESVDEKYYMSAMWNERIMPVGNANFVFGLALAGGKVHERDTVCHARSVVPCLSATEYKSPRKVYIE